MTRKEILEAAKKCVCTDRNNQYGSPEDSFSFISELWTAYKGVPFTAVDVSMMMALLKIARISTGVGTDDSFIDLAGYAACGGEIMGNIREHKPIGNDNYIPPENISNLCNCEIQDSDFLKIDKTDIVFVDQFIYINDLDLGFCNPGFRTFEAASRILNNLRLLIKFFGCATIKDLYSMCDISFCSNTEKYEKVMDKYGWTCLDEAFVKAISYSIKASYVIIFPKIEKLDTEKMMSDNASTT